MGGRYKPEIAKQRRERYKLEGRCTRCAKPRERLEVTQCTSCYQKQECTRVTRYNVRKSKNLCISCGFPTQDFALCKPCRIVRLQNFRKVKREVINHYGGQCIQCGDTRLGCLELDHVNNDGAENRREIDGNPKYRTGTKLHQWLLDHNFETKYEIQILCANCHALKHWAGDYMEQIA